MKKYLVILLALVLAITMFTACGGASEEPAEGSDSGSAADGSLDPATIKTFEDVFSVADEENSQYAFTDTVYVYAFPYGDDFYRAEVELTEEESNALWELDFEDPEHDAKMKEIVSPLEITTFTNLAEGAPDQAYLDSLVGKTGGELFDDGWSYNYYNLEDMEAGLDHGVYSFMVTFEYEGEQMENTDDFDFYEEFRNLKIKEITYEGIGDGTYIPDAQD